MAEFLQIGQRVVNLDLLVAVHREERRVFCHYSQGNTWSYKLEEGGAELWAAVVERARVVYSAGVASAASNGPDAGT